MWPEVEEGVGRGRGKICGIGACGLSRSLIEMCLVDVEGLEGKDRCGKV